jgi:hypothetical protein
LLAVLAIGSYAASTGGSTQSGQLAIADSANSETVAGTSASEPAYFTSDFSWH